MWQNHFIPVKIYRLFHLGRELVKPRSLDTPYQQKVLLSFTKKVLYQQMNGERKTTSI